MEHRQRAAIGLGCMRLSTSPDREFDRAVKVIHAALDAGATLLDTADAYCHDEHDLGHNERLIANALSSWSGDASVVTVASKGGLTRPGGRWVPDGRAKHLAAGCEASLKALGEDRIDLYQLHVPDPARPFATSVRALARLQETGHVRRVGLCNVNVAQIEEAREIAEISSVQVELSPLRMDAVRGGVVSYCAREAIELLAYSPLGGPRRIGGVAADAVLAAIASELDVTPLQVVLAWLRTLAPVVVPIPGATRAETAVSAVQGQLLELKDEQRQALDEHFHPAVASRTSTRPPRPRSAALGEVVLVMGYPGAGKSTVAASLVAEGYERFNRDEQGGTLASLAASLDRGLEAGTSRAVLDNTYANRKSRNGVVEVARRHGAAVRCVWLGTSLEEAQVNVARRMIQCHGRLLTPEEMKSARQDSTAVPPRALFDYRRAFEEPALEEGFARIDEVPFERTAASGRSKRVLIVDYDQVAAADGALHPRCKEALQRYAAEGWAIALTAWWPDADDAVGKEASSRRAGRVARELALEIDLEYCRHGAGPPVCWCRKPLPGLGVVLIERHGLDPSESLLVASGPADRTFAARLGFSVVDANELF